MDLMIWAFIFGFAVGITMTLAVSMIVWSRIVSWAKTVEASRMFETMAEQGRKRAIDKRGDSV